MNHHFIFRAASLVLALFFSVVTLLSFGDAAAQTTTPLGDATFEPSVGQGGKDVIWVPTPDALAANMLKTANVKPTDLVYDLGAGDGKIAITATKKFGATAVGIEFNPKLAQLATRNAKRAGVSDKVKFIKGDIFVEDFSRATVVTL
jgi:SAM-dependent methyltransferase